MRGRDHIQACESSLNRGVLFDFGGTLDADGLPWKERCRRLLRDEGLVLEPERFDPLFYAADDRLVGRLPPTLGLRATARLLVGGLMEALGLGDPMLTERVASRFADDARAQLRVNTSLLAALHHRYDLGIVSNFYGNLPAVCDEVGIGRFFKVVVDSTRVGCAKPDPRIFVYALDALGLAPADAVFVGDSPSRDMAGARGVGMPHVWLCADPSASPCCPHDRVITSLTSLEALLA